MESESLSDLYNSLSFALKKNDYEKSLSFANRILQQDAKEEKAFHCKIVALINLSRFEDGWQFINKNKDKFPKSFSFEKAYCEYRLNRFQESLVTLETSCNMKEAKCLELKAQILYRQEEFKQALNLYLAIIKDSTDEFSQEREANLAAVNAAACLFQNQSLYNISHFREQTYEICFNNASSLISGGQFEEASKLLEKAKGCCLESFENEADEELAPCLVQMAYLLQLQGKQQEANEIYQKLLKEKPKDGALMAVISNNVVCVNKDQNIFDSKKRIKVATADNLKYKLFAQQKNAIMLNQCLLQHVSNQGEACKKAVVHYLKDEPSNEKAALIYASQFVKEKNFTEAIRFLKKFCSDMSERQSIVTARLSLAQILLQQNALSQCTTQLLLLPPEVLYSDKMIAAVLTLYSTMENREAACKFLEEACEFYSIKGNIAKHQQLVKRCARLNESCGFHPRAAELYLQLMKSSPGDQKLIALLVNAYANFNPSKAEETSRLLKKTGFSKRQPEVPLDQLESCFSLGSRYTKKVTPKDHETKEDDIVAKRRHKKKKGKLPKNCDPNVLPDPERWIARRERSYFRGKRKDRRAGKLARGNQGSSAAAGQLDFGAKASVPKAGDEASPSTSPKPESEIGASKQPFKPPQPAKSAASSKKKKNKGGRW